MAGWHQVLTVMFLWSWELFFLRSDTVRYFQRLPWGSAWSAWAAGKSQGFCQVWGHCCAVYWKCWSWLKSPLCFCWWGDWSAPGDFLLPPALSGGSTLWLIILISSAKWKKRFNVSSVKNEKFCLYLHSCSSKPVWPFSSAEHRRRYFEECWLPNRYPLTVIEFANNNTETFLKMFSSMFHKENHTGLKWHDDRIFVFRRYISLIVN